MNWIRALKATLATAAVVSWFATIILTPPGLRLLLVGCIPVIVGLWLMFYHHWFRETK